MGKGKLILQRCDQFEIGREYALANGERGAYIGTSDSTGMLPWSFTRYVVNENSFELFAKRTKEGFMIYGVRRKDLLFKDRVVASVNGKINTLDLKRQQWKVLCKGVERTLSEEDL